MEKKGPPLKDNELSLKDAKRYEEIFRKLDTNSDGTIAFNELSAALRKLGVPHSQLNVKDIIDKHDSNHSGSLEFKEFLSYMIEQDKKLMLVFNCMDINKDGKIDADEIISAFKNLGIKIDHSEAIKLLKRMDKDKSLTISYDEWRDYLMFHPNVEIKSLIQYWRHSTYVDIGEASLVPEDFTETEKKTGAWWRHLVAGGVAGAVSRTFTAPVDRVKVFLQVKGTEAGSITSCFKQMLKEGGWRSLWRGNGINIIKIAPESALKFAAYEQIKHLIYTSGNSKEIGIRQRFIAGSLAGITAQSLIYPLEVLKTRMAIRYSGQYRNLADAMMKIYRNEGALAFYRGYVPNSFGILPYAGIDLAVYETLKQMYLSNHKEDENPGVMVLLACGAISSSCGQVASYPLSLLKTRLQAQTTSMKKRISMLDLGRTIIEKEGFSGLYRGIGPNFLKVIPAVSISYVVYEYTRQALGAQMT